MPRKDLGPRFCYIATNGVCQLLNKTVISKSIRCPQQLIDEIDLHPKKQLLAALFKSLTVSGYPDDHHYVNVDCLDGDDDPSIFFHKYYLGTRWKLSEIVVNNRVDFDQAKRLINAKPARQSEASRKRRMVLERSAERNT